jgi:transposase
MTKTAAEAGMRFGLMKGFLDERTRRLFAASEAKVMGRGGVSAVARATGVSRRAVAAGLDELEGSPCVPGTGSGRVRRPGGGRKRVVDCEPEILAALERLIDPVTRGDPESPLRWTCKSLRRLARELRPEHQVSHVTVGEMLQQLGYSLQANRKTTEGSSHPDRNAQFEFINTRCLEQQAAGNPVISVDTKKKELVGDFKNGGREYRPKGSPEPVRVHDFKIPELGRANLYGVYDLKHNMGWVNLGVDHDTAAFAVESIRRWWRGMGSGLYREARQLQIVADGGGSNGTRVRLWKKELQELAEELGMPVCVCHLPPGTSKWNKIEHRLFSFITMNWRGRPLVSHEVIINLIKSTTTQTGLSVEASLDENEYPAGIKVSDEEMAALNLVRDDFHGEWNYTLEPRQKQLELR